MISSPARLGHALGRGPPIVHRVAEVFSFDPGIAVMYCDARNERENKRRKLPNERRRLGARAACVGEIPLGICDTLEAIAREGKILLDCVVRDAAQQYTGEKRPLFKNQG